MHGYCSNFVFIHKFTPTDVGDFLLKLCKISYFFHFTHLCQSWWGCSKSAFTPIKFKNCRWSTARCFWQNAIGVEFWVKSKHGKTGGSSWIRVGSIGLWVKRVTSQKKVILSGLKTSSSQSDFGLGRVDQYFSHEFFF